MTTVLVVDDSATDRRVAGGLLEKSTDYTIVYAVDGQDALEQLELHLPDLVVTDLQMPKMDGLELVASVKSEYPLIPVVLMTARGSEEMAVQALQSGASSYVPKRKLSTELLETIERVLSASHVDRSDSRLMHRIVKHETHFELENDVSLIPSVVNHLQQTMKRMRLCGETECLRVGVALEEALLNAYYHGNLEVSSEIREEDHTAYYEMAQQRSQAQPYRDRKIQVSASFSPDGSQFVISDEGPGFDWSGLPDATDPSNLDRPCGRGVLLMKTFMDDITFNDKGNIVTLLKRRTLGEDLEDDPPTVEIGGDS